MTGLRARRDKAFESFDFEKVFLTFVRARCRAQGASPELRRRILDELLDE